jgi:hypothetical protein
MGLFSKAKDAQKQAQDAMANMGGMSGAGGAQAGGGMAGMAGMSGQDMAAMAAESQKLNTIHQTGVEAPAVLKGIRAVGSPDISGGTRHEFDVTIVPDGGNPYDATVSQVMLPAQMESLAEGAAVTVKYDPSNPSAAILTSW